MVLKIQLNIVTKKLIESDVWVFSFCPCWLPHIGWRGLYEFWSEQIFGFQIERPRGGDPEWSGGRRGGGWGWRNPASSGVVWCMTELTGKWGWSSWGWQQPTPPSFHQRSVSSCHHTNSHNSSSSWATYTNPWFFMCMCEWWLTGVRVVQYAIWDRRRTCREKAQALLVASFHPELSSLFSSCSVHHNTTHLDILHSLNDQTWW